MRSVGATSSTAHSLTSDSTAGRAARVAADMAPCSPGCRSNSPDGRHRANSASDVATTADSRAMARDAAAARSRCSMPVVEQVASGPGAPSPRAPGRRRQPTMPRRRAGPTRTRSPDQGGSPRPRSAQDGPAAPSPRRVRTPRGRDQPSDHWPSVRTCVRFYRREQAEPTTEKPTCGQQRATRWTKAVRPVTTVGSPLRPPPRRRAPRRSGGRPPGARPRRPSPALRGGDDRPAAAPPAPRGS